MMRFRSEIIVYLLVSFKFEIESKKGLVILVEDINKIIKDKYIELNCVKDIKKSVYAYFKTKKKNIFIYKF
jgi:hypothetical protein